MTGRRARLNVFQKTQRLWETVHPYNAAQAMELTGDAPPLRIANAFNEALDDLRLGEFVCDGRSYFVRPGGTRVGVTRTRQAFESYVSEEMNRPFDSDVTMPFRPFDLHGVNRPHLVGLTYQHWVADSVSIRLLMRQWFRRITGTAGGCAPVRLPAKGLLGAFGPTAAGWSPMAQTSSLFSLSSRMRKMRRVDAHAGRDVRVLLRAGPDGVVDAVKRRARAEGATVGDVMLAAAAEACAAHGPAHRTDRRPGLCVGTIVDLRARQKAGDDVFGLFLGFLMTDFSARQARRFESLLARAVAARRMATARKSAEASQLNLAVGYGLARVMGERRMLEFYRKRFPLAGGLSSVNMTPGWAGDAHPTPLAAYHRVSPTGPMLPVALTPTTLGERLRVCFTYRTALMDATAADALVTAFFERLIKYAG